MTGRLREPSIPKERQDTLRREIATVLGGHPLSAKEVSVQIRVSEKEVYEHLEHIRKTLSKGDCRLIVTPAECVKCGFVFRKRERLRKPGRCPVCKGEVIREPLFSIRGTCEKS